MTGSPTKASKGRKRKANEVSEMSPEKPKTRKSPQDPRPSTPTPVTSNHQDTLLVTTQHTTADFYDGTDEDEDMYYDEETATLDNLSTFNRPTTLTEEQMINNIAFSLEDTINMARAAKEAGLGDILRNAKISNLINLISDAANEKTSKQIEALSAMLHNISGKIDKMEERLTQKLQKHVEETEGRLTNALHEVKAQVEESMHQLNKKPEQTDEADKHKETTKPESYAKAATKSITKARGNEDYNTTSPTTNNNKGDTKTHPAYPTAAYHPSRAVITYQQGIPENQKLAPADICETLNAALAEMHKEKEIQVVAARYTQHGNLIINTRADQNATDFVKIAESVITRLHPGIMATARADVKWWKIQVDGVSTRRTTIGGEIYTHNTETIHKELTNCNPGYAKISSHVIAKPRWLRTADELQLIPYSSVVFAVDDEVAAKSLLKNGKLAAFGRYCTLRPFQDRPPVIQCTNCWGWEHREATCKIRRRCRLCSESHAEDEHPTRGPCDKCREQAEMVGDTIMDDEDCVHRLKCANCTIQGWDNLHHAADNRRCRARIEKWGTARANEKKAIKNNEPWTIVKAKTKPRDKKKENGKKIPSGIVNPIASQNTFTPLETLNPAQTAQNNCNTEKI
ncbi:hypothetical protein D9619_008775 [Psilocybe cf. subviscida]|uniref:Gag-like protein n=1 Tax=Psilocybe cf. subviscida TaxID=2480587 RepID=A0A8H5B9W8_9AGAR|nr:hypothetical protein D9619_008775 [Psilocybe cf. subviscida]